MGEPPGIGGCESHPRIKQVLMIAIVLLKMVRPEEEALRPRHLGVPRHSQASLLFNHGYQFYPRIFRSDLRSVQQLSVASRANGSAFATFVPRLKRRIVEWEKSLARTNTEHRRCRGDGVHAEGSSLDRGGRTPLPLSGRLCQSCEGGPMSGARYRASFFTAIVTLGEIVHESIEHAVCVALGARLPARHVDVPQAGLARSDHGRQATVAGGCVLDDIGIEFSKHQPQRLLHGGKGSDLMIFQV